MVLTLSTLVWRSLQYLGAAGSVFKRCAKSYAQRLLSVRVCALLTVQGHAMKAARTTGGALTVVVTVPTGVAPLEPATVPVAVTGEPAPALAGLTVSVMVVVAGETLRGMV